MIRIFHQRFNAFDAHTRKKLRRATLVDGYMRQFSIAFPDSPVLAVFGKRHLLGWALVLHPGLHGVPLVSTFVNERYRGRGVGTLLITQAVKRHRTIHLASWNTDTARLFERLRSRFPKNILVIDWYDYAYVFSDMLEEAESSRDV